MNAKAASDKAQSRIEAQRARILAAAHCCFVESGFHAASMASIAQAAGMSAGLIYRYFESKNAIILAIVERQLELLRDAIHLNRQVDLANELTENYGQSCPGELGMNAALLLEISAEATRDPQIAAALDDFDTTLREALIEWLSRAKKDSGCGVASAQAAGRALVLQCLLEGLKFREAREPNLDRALLREALQANLPRLLG